MHLLNFSHPLNQEQVAEIERHCEQAVGQVYDIPVFFEQEQPFEDQARALIEGWSYRARSGRPVRCWFICPDIR